MKISESIGAFIRDHHLLTAGQRVLAAVSGGADSFCLLAVLQDLGFDLVVAHFDHGLRKESGLDAKKVADLADRMKISCRLGTGNVNAFAKAHRLSLEEAARILRYRFLGAEAVALGIQTIAVGHTADDQAETVMMHLLRGAGPAGLHGILPSIALGAWLPEFAESGVRIIRPLLEIRRDQTEAVCQDQNWIPVRDPSNQDTSFWRNRIRHELLPMLVAYNPRAVEGIGRLAALMRAQTEYMEAQTSEKWIELAERRSEGEILMHRSKFQCLPRALQQTIVRRAFLTLRPNLRDLAQRHVEQAIDFIGQPSHTRQSDVALGIGLAVEGEFILFRQMRTPTARPAWEGRSLPIPGFASLDSVAWDLSSTVETGSLPPEAFRQQDKFLAFLDADRIEASLYVRCRLPGDAFEPLGMKKMVKLSDFLAAQHMPRFQRDTWPLICDAQSILWVPGYRIGERAKVTKDTTRWITIRVHRPEESAKKYTAEKNPSPEEK